jgi:hypothetical protein
MNTADRTPAQLYSLLFGIVLLAVGIIGFFVDSSFDTGSNVQGDDLIVFEVNGWHNLVHIASGLVGIAMSRTNATARLFALGFGGVYLIVTIWGFITGDQVLWLIPVNAADNVLHLAIAVAGIAAGLASPHPDRPGAATSRPRTA